MIFLAPAWLGLLLPWALLALWLLRRSKRSAPVPFVSLWRAEHDATPVIRRRFEFPLHLILILLAMLTLILAAAQPGIRWSTVVGQPVWLIVDTGLEMSAGRNQTTIASSLVQEVAKKLRVTGNSQQPINVVIVPGQGAQLINLNDLTGLAEQLPSTAIDTQQMVESTVRQVLEQADAPVIVVSNHKLDVRDDRLMQQSSSHLADNAGIVAASVGDGSSAQLMVRVVNQSRQTAGRLLINHQPPIDITLPPPGQMHNYFIDLPEPLPLVMQIKLEPDDELTMDNQWWLVQQQRAPRIEIDGQVPVFVTRMVQVYQAQHPAEAQAPQIWVSTANWQSAAPIAPTVILADGSSGHQVEGAVEVRPHVLSSDIDWEKVLYQPVIVTQLPDDGWSVVLQRSGQALLAVKENPRRVWIGFDLSAMANQPAFVILWANIFDWLGGEEGDWKSEEPHDLGQSWQRITPAALPAGVAPGWVAGVYQQDGQLLAVNARGRIWDEPAPSDGLGHLDRWAQSSGYWALQPMLALLALALVLLATGCWPRPGE